MNEFPRIVTALPRRRYRFGDYGVTLLGEVESSDGIDYRYILAFIEDGQSRPGLYVCSERNPPGQRSEGQYRLRLINEAMAEDLGSDDAWGEQEAFAERALALGARVLGLTSERLVPLG